MVYFNAAITAVMAALFAAMTHLVLVETYRLFFAVGGY